MTYKTLIAATAVFLCTVAGGAIAAPGGGGMGAG